MIQCENLVKIYKTDEIEVVALQGLDLTVDDGEMMAIIGNSGSGKSTLLNMIGGLDRPSAGALEVAGQDLLKFDEQRYMKYKRETVGFVWQNNARNLVPYLTAQQNVELPMLLSGGKERGARARDLLDLVGLTHRRGNRLNQLSGGEQQRIAIAIALANRPQLLLADEPTGAVDTQTAAQIMEIFRRINRETGLTIVIVTHDLSLSRQVDRVVAIRDGRTSSEFVRRNSYLDTEFTGTLEEGTEEEHVELAVVDGAGRVQIPKEYLSRLGIKGKSKLKVEQLDDGRVVLQTPQQAEAASPPNHDG